MLNSSNDRKIDVLMYADDLVLVGHSRIELQRKLVKLHSYYKENCMSVNIKKSNILVFHSRKSTQPFKYDNITIVEVDSFKYLGITFCRSGALTLAQEKLSQQARRAQATLDLYLIKHKHLPVKTIFELFDTLIRPILLFGSEIYGMSISNDIEQLHISFIKKYKCDVLTVML